MLKDFLYELFGLRFYGTQFEQIFFSVIALIGAYLLFQTWRAMQAKKEEENHLTRGAVAAAMFLGGGYMAFKAFTQDPYQLFFESPLVLHTYGVMIASGFVVAIWFAIREAKRTGLDPARVMDLAFWLLVAGLVGSRIVFMMVEFDEYYNLCFDPAAVGKTEPDCMAPFRFWQGGLVFYGGFIGAAATGMFYLRKNKLPVLRYVDAAVPSVAIGQFFGRLGCLAAGCCHGKYIPSERALALEWPEGTAAYNVILPTMEAGADLSLFSAEKFVTAHPTQLYESGTMLLVFLFLIWFRSRKQFNGQVLVMYLMTYAVARGTIELFRGDKVRGFVFEWTNPAISEFLGLRPDDPLLLSTSQTISVAMFVGGIVAWIFLKKKSEERKAALEAAHKAKLEELKTAEA